MSLKIQNAKLNYFKLIIDNSSSIEDITVKLVKLYEFNDNYYYLSIDFTPLIFDENYVELATLVIKEALAIGFKILFIKSEHLSNLAVDFNLVKQFPQDTQSNEVPEIIFNSTKVINDTIRSGVEIIHDGDIIIHGLVSYGAEIKATGNIHIYGECRGKLFAGINGDKTTRIYINNFNAEAVGIATTRCIVEDNILAKLKNKQVCVILDDKARINITPIT